jgi:hypothetical protein
MMNQLFIKEIQTKKSVSLSEASYLLEKHTVTNPIRIITARSSSGRFFLNRSFLEDNFILPAGSIPGLPAICRLFPVQPVIDDVFKHFPVQNQLNIQYFFMGGSVVQCSVRTLKRNSHSS